MKILVTGATGFLGRVLSTRLDHRGHEVVRLNSRNCPLNNREAIERFNDRKYDQIYHLAAWTKAGDFCLHHSGEQWVINQQINTNVLAWWQEHQPQAKMISIGTSCAYDPNLELKEENYLVGSPIDSLYTYGMTKRMLYVGLRSLHQQFGVDYLYVIPSTLYGTDYPVDGRPMHFIFELICKIIRGKVQSAPVILWGDGSQRREVVLLEDFVSLLVELASGRSNNIVNIGAGEEFSIRHFAKLICEQVGYDAEKIRYDPARYVGAVSKCLDVQKVRMLVPGMRLTPLKVGLEKTIRWFWDERDRWLPFVKDAKE